MQKLFLLLIVACLIVTLVGCSTPSTDSLPPLSEGAIAVDSDEFYIGKDKVAILPLQDAYLYTEYGVDMAFRFAMERAEYDYLSDNFPDLEIRGRYMEYYEDDESDYTAAVPAEIIEQTINDDAVFFSVSIGGVTSDKYNTDFVTLLEISFTDTEGTPYVIRNCSSVARVYDVALAEYTDRSEKGDDKYLYIDSFGDYSPYPDLSVRRTILYSTLHISVENGTVTDLCAMDYYTSPYRLSYFDGILTIEMANGADIDTGLLKYIYINGVNTYFSPYGGRIQLVVD